MSDVRPYEPLNMTTDLWFSIPTSNIEMYKLVPSQFHLNSTWKPGGSFCGDAFPHIVYFNGLYYISDGHNRIQYARSKGVPFIEVRVIYKIDDQILVPLERTA